MLFFRNNSVCYTESYRRNITEGFSRDIPLSEHATDAITAKGERTPEQLASLEEHNAVLEEVKRKVHMMTSGRPLNRY